MYSCSVGRSALVIIVELEASKLLEIQDVP